MIFSTSANLGDCLWALVALRRLGGEHTFYCKPEYVADLAELMGDTQTSVKPLSEATELGIDTWIANGQFEPEGVQWMHQNDIMGFVGDYFNALGVRHFGRKTFESRHDMLWDSRAIIDALPTVPHPGVLVVNSDPMSGQTPQYSRDEMNALLVHIGHDYGGCVATSVIHRPNYSLAQIAAMSLTAHTIIAVANGPHWPTWNVWNKKARRIILLDNGMFLDFHTGCRMDHCANAGQVFEKLKEMAPYA